LKIHVVLHLADGDHLLFAGTPSECPPIPKAGDELIHKERRVRLEGIRYQSWADRLEIGAIGLAVIQGKRRQLKCHRLRWETMRGPQPLAFSFVHRRLRPRRMHHGPQ